MPKLIKTRETNKKIKIYVIKLEVPVKKLILWVYRVKAVII